MAFNAQGAVQGGMSGASAGSMMGPWGALGMGVAGALAGGFLGGGNDGKKMQREAWDRQEMWMQNQLGWRVQDAVRAGVHPLAAIGSNLSPPTPATVIGGEGSNLGGDLAQMGQGVGRALSAGMSEDAKYETTLRSLQIERGELENAKLRFDLQQMHTQAGNPPGLVVSPQDQPLGFASGTRGHFSPSNYPVSVQSLPPMADAAGLKLSPSEQFSSVPGQPSFQPSSNPASRWMDLPAGGKAAMPGEAWQIDEAGAPGYVMWMLQNGFIPALPFGQRLVPAPEKKYERPGQTGWTYKLGLGWLPDFRRLTGWEKYDQQWAPLAPR